MALTPLPAAPSSSRPTTFNSDMDTFLAALALFVTQANAIGTPGLGGGQLLGALENAADITIASVAGVTDIGALTSNDVIITGNNTITGLGNTASKAKRRTLITGSPVFKANSSIFLSRDLQAAPGDILDWYRDSGGYWRLENAILSGGPLISTFSSVGLSAATWTQVATLTPGPGTWEFEAQESSFLSSGNYDAMSFATSTGVAGATMGVDMMYYGRNATSGTGAGYMKCEKTLTASQQWYFNLNSSAGGSGYGGFMRAKRTL